MKHKTISFKRESIPNLIADVKKETRRLKKEGEYLLVDTPEGLDVVKEGDFGSVVVKDSTGKFEVGEVYQVVVDDRPIFYCLDCGFLSYAKRTRCPMEGKKIEFKPFLIKVLSIKEQKLMDITNAEAEAEVGTGLKYPRKVFFKDFWECYAKRVPTKFFWNNSFASISEFNDSAIDVLEDWNPSVWALEIEKVIE